MAPAPRRTVREAVPFETHLELDCVLRIRIGLARVPRPSPRGKRRSSLLHAGQHPNRDAALAAYREACTKHKVSPLSAVMFQVKSASNIDDRCEELDFRGTSLHQNDCEALEEIFRRILFYKVNLDGAIAEDNSAEVLFQIFEFYEATAHLDLSNNKAIGSFGWQACSRMLRKVSLRGPRFAPRPARHGLIACAPHADHLAEAAGRRERAPHRGVHDRAEPRPAIRLPVRTETRLVPTLRSTAGATRWVVVASRLAPPPDVSLRSICLSAVIALKFNMALRQLYLCGNQLCGGDCLQIQTLLKFNCRLSYLDLSDNLIADDGIYYVTNGLTHQLHFGKFSKSKKGLESLILWNNQLTRRSACHLNAAIKACKTLKYLSLGANRLTDDTLMDIRDSLMGNDVLLKLDLRSAEITCFGCSELARVLRVNSVLEKLDLRDNPIYKVGVQHLIDVVQFNRNLTEVNVDDKSKIKTTTRIKMKYSDMAKQLQSFCESNRQLLKQEELSRSESDEEDENDDDDDIFGEDELDNLEEPQEELPTEYKRYVTWKI
ncbi:protein phosphatase 1 regulatory subunit 37 isoform X3 [Phymastichus coffea]|uniref:protein phosphatase 1 regulatory subunit 37 isoform X3 n=1 Tax=Phymastichus coffea TaxID=108790 RepID=UPI00273B43A9|nr:protein phosphatase 1 regulatory subunit 37 isoform X3 [Phymastichus coffea]XP_058804878.1 protein phosphatase 1 regulatory subunit 37 isoform X3 [Phymastichus coffea]